MLDISGEPRLGVTRKTQEWNAMLIRPEIGKVRKPTRKLPGQEHAYGINMVQDPENAKEVTMVWKEHEPNPDNKPGPDFMAMNLASIKSECTTASETRIFRETHDIRIKQGSPTKTRREPLIPSDYNPEHVYGRSTLVRTYAEKQWLSCDTPIKKLIQNDYGDEWIRMNEARQEELNRQHEKVPPKTTRAALGHASKAKLVAEQQQPKERFVLSKFKNVPTKIDNKQTLPLQRD
ncbi:hypothetical protein KFL_000390210 [Klebsormidium nitens]|uniref:Uncharacterized protein n=1 Tax=Klebsormidium nitens TaxID=105231 RepID=A0A1Y1HS67_KLENI|nr:hypothetical protein KFL_000390210 [Klebsormidium nitens]|eukprot:GAQ79831.1 hypothetical protein KFL_000390210 [Klebsormidium nitens]